MKEFNFNPENVRQALLWIGLPLLVGLIFASAITQPVVGVIRLDDAIHAWSARSLVTQIEYAIDHPEIRAVVLALDSPGGTVVDTEAIYMELTRLRERKPVVTAINGMSASGAYYLSANTDYIYAKPTSLVGNVGVIGYLPPTPFIFEDIISTGPYKLWGAPRDSDMRQIEMIKQGFYQAVLLGRGERLEIGPETLLRGQIWVGAEALHLGVIDELGTETDAARKAADIANVAHFDVIDLSTLVDVPLASAAFFIQSPQGVTLPYPNEAGIYMLYIPPLPVQE
jgi:protease-4